MKWPTSADGLVHIPVCVKGDGIHPMPPAYAQRWVSDAVKLTWNTVSNVRFEGFNACPNTTAQFVVLRLKDELTGPDPDGSPPDSGGNGAVGAIGLQAADAPGQTVDMTVSPAFQTRGRIEHVAVHEFGHVLGFQHEHARSDRPSVCPKDPSINPTFVSITDYDQDSIMNYCGEHGNFWGPLTKLDIQGVQAFYAPNPSNDDDGDGIPDRIDNCPYASNRDQQDSNFEAEWKASQNQGYPSNDGHVPTALDPQSYVDHWHDAYAGDACDPTPVARIEIDRSRARQGGIACPGSGNSPGDITFQGYRSTAVGTRGTKSEIAKAAFCKCNVVPSPGQNMPIACSIAPSALCTIGDDSTFPGGGAPTNFKTMSSCELGGPATTTLEMESTGAGWGYTPLATGVGAWNAAYDAVQFGVAPGTLGGIAWGHAKPLALSWPPPPPFPGNLSNHYSYEIDTVINLGFVPADLCVGCQAPWLPMFGKSIDWLPSVLVFGNDPVFGKTPIFQGPGGIVQARSEFTSPALEAFKIANTEVVPSLENTTGVIAGRTTTSGVLINAGTGYLRGAFSMAADKRITYQTATGNIDENITTPVRLFVASEGTAGTLFSVRGSSVIKQDVAAALALTPSRVATAMWGDVPSSPRAGAWDVGTRMLRVLDVTGTTTKRLRLIEIREDGYAKIKWQSPAVASSAFPTNYYLQTASQGELLVSISYAYTGGSEWVLIGKDGKATHGGVWTSPLASPPFISNAFIGAPFRRTGGTPQEGPLRIESTSRARLPLGACATTWLKTFVPSTPCGDAWDGSQPAEDGDFVCTNP